MKKFFLLFLFIFSHLSNAQKLSPESEISLLTISPGEELWSFAGHTALRVKDPVNGLDVNFNYGVFDFRTESFYLKFLRGTLPYQIGVYNFHDEVPYWQYEKRGITQQTLRLNTDQKQKLYDFLLENYRPENREYNYKFFYDNCSTRFRDAIQTICGDSLKFSQTLNKDRTYRNWIRIYSDSCRNDWAQFGMDMLIGIPSDQETGVNGAMYIPGNLMTAFDSAQIYSDGQWLPLVSIKSDINLHTIEAKSPAVKPFAFFSIVFFLFLYISYLEKKNQKWYLWLDKLLFSLTGLSGIILLLLWFFTNHGVTSNNLNILWTFPLVLPAIWSVSKTNLKRPFAKRTFFLQMILSLILLIGFSILPQSFDVAVLPLAGIVLTRSYLLWKRLN
jgi:hypothetical protein